MMRNFLYGGLVLLVGCTCPDVSSDAGRSYEPFEDWTQMFDGRTLEGWEEVDYAGHGETRIENEALRFEPGEELTGVRWTNDLPRMNYEVNLEGRRLEGVDFFCGLTAPHHTNSFTVVLGGWGGTVVGISSIDGFDAADNETGAFFEFDMNTWYKIKLRVTEENISVWIDDKNVIDFDTEGRRIGMRAGEIEYSMPFGLCAWQTKGEIKNVWMRKIPAEPPNPTL